MSRSQEQGQSQLAAARGETERLQRQVAEGAAAAQEQAGMHESRNHEMDSLRYRSHFVTAISGQCHKKVSYSGGQMCAFAASLFLCLWYVINVQISHNGSTFMAHAMLF